MNDSFMRKDNDTAAAAAAG
jgi:hypothetical protein